MKKSIITIYCLWAVKLLLCIFLLFFLSCGSLKNIDGTTSVMPQSILQIAVKKSDFEIFNLRIQELELVTVDFRPAVTNLADRENNEFWLTFRFANEIVLHRGYVAIMSNGLARRISYRYQ